VNDVSVFVHLKPPIGHGKLLPVNGVIAGKLTRLAVQVRDAFGTQGPKTQTVNVFDDSNTEGNYREVYRIHDPEMFVSATQIGGAVRTLSELDSYLVALGAVKEGPRHR